MQQPASQRIRIGTLRESGAGHRFRILIFAGLLVLALTPLTGPADAARKARVPLPAVQLPVAVDWQPEYDGQDLCSEWAKPGAVKFSELLRRTYGRYTTYISRSCATSGISEHEEGRAIDWMVDSENPTTRAKARAVLRWLTGPGPNGEPGAMARRLGVMYLIYDDRMWRAYRPQDGWQQYNGCFSRQSDSFDTSCHRDHIHISLTWDGAYAKTSFWTGKAETRPPCASGTVNRPNGSPSDPKPLINTDTGVGVPGKNCRLARGRSYAVRVPVPSGTTRPVQRVQLQAFDLNAPVGMTISSAGRLTIPQGTRPGGVFEIPLARDGVIRFSVEAGYGQIALRGLGTGAPNTTPATAELAPFGKNWLVNLPVTVTGKLVNPPLGAKVKVMRRLQTGGPFRKVASAAAFGDRFEIATPAVPAPGVYEYRVRVRRAGTTVARSAPQALRINPAVMSLTEPAPVPAGTKAVFTGGILGAPERGAKLQLQVKRDGSWSKLTQRKIGNGGYTIQRKFAEPGSYQVRTALISGTRVWAVSTPRTLTVRTGPAAPAR